MNLPPKTEDKKPATKAPAQAELVSFKVTGKRVQLLVPYEEDQRRLAEELMSEKYAYDDLPKVVSQIKVRKLGEDNVIFVAAAKATKIGHKRQPTDFVLQVSDPIECKKFIVGSGSDEDGDVDAAAVIDAIQRAAFPLIVHVSTDGILKLLTA